MFSRLFTLFMVLVYFFIIGISFATESATNQISDNPQQEFRTWTDKTGKFKTEAVFVDFKEDSVRLKKKDGSIISVPIEKLSKADQEWLMKEKSVTVDGDYRVYFDIRGDCEYGDDGLQRRLFYALQKAGCKMTKTKEQANILVEVSWIAQFDESKIYAPVSSGGIAPIGPHPFSLSTSIHVSFLQRGIRKMIFDGFITVTSPSRIKFIVLPTSSEVTKATVLEWQREYDKQQITDRLVETVREVVTHPENLTKTIHDTLEKAKGLIDTHPVEAKRYLSQIVEKFPDENAAKEARDLLDAISLRDLVNKAKAVMQTDPYRAHELLNDALAKYPYTRFSQEARDLFAELERRRQELETAAQNDLEKVKPLAKTESLTARSQLLGVYNKYSNTRAGKEAGKLWSEVKNKADRDAAKQLKIAKLYPKDAQDLMRSRLEEIVDKYADTPSGKEAQDLLKKKE